MSAPFTMDSTRGVVTVTIHGELDLLSAPTLRDQIADVRADKPSGIVIDLSQMEFMDSSGLGVLVQLARQANEEGWELSLREPSSERVQRLFDITKTRSLFSWQ